MFNCSTSGADALTYSTLVAGIMVLVARIQSLPARWAQRGPTLEGSSLKKKKKKNKKVGLN